MRDPGGAGRSDTVPRPALLLAALGVVVLLAVALWSGLPGEQPGASGSPAATVTASAAATAGESPAMTDGTATPTLVVQTFPVPAGSRPHDVAPAEDGGVWYTAQRKGVLGLLDPVSGRVDEVSLGDGSAPHGVIVGPDGAPWITDAGLNAIVRVDPATREVNVFPLPDGSPSVGLNTAAFDATGTLWFTGNAGFYGRLDPSSSEVRLFDAPRGAGPYGICATPAGDIYYASLQGSYLGAVDTATGDVGVLDPPTAGAGVRRCWSDSGGRIWVSEWDAGQLGLYDPAADTWLEWRLPGDAPRAYAVFVDDGDVVWVSDFGSNAIVRFDPATETFTAYELPDRAAEVRQLNGRPREVWGAESAADALVRVTPSG